MARGRLAKRPSVAPPPNFRPLFIALHWHSDPGDDRWVDKSGRRQRSSFIENCREEFDLPPIRTSGTEAQFLNDFEDMFEFMARISSSELNALGPDIDALSKNLTEALEKYPIRLWSLSVPATTDQKICSLWKCYTEAQNKAYLSDQQEEARPVGGPFRALRTIGKFLLGTLGLAAIVALIGIPEILLAYVETAWNGLLDFTPGGSGFVLWQKVLTGLGLYVVAIAVFGLLLYFCWYLIYYRKDSESRPQGSPLIPILLWAPLQLLTSLPILLGLIVTFVFRSGLVLVGLGLSIYYENWWWVGGFAVVIGFISFILSITGKVPLGLYSEKAASKYFNWRDWLAKFARVPIRWLRNMVSEESAVMRLAEAVDSQLAFFEMQRKGAEVGREAGEFLLNLMAELASNESDEAGPRIHLIGHSFGGLVIANAAREFVRLQGAKSSTKAVLQDLIFVQPAMASNWFEREKALINEIKAPVSCVFSAYDSANGFWYPLANNGRLAAGYVGLSKVASTTRLGERGVFSTLVAPPPLQELMPKPQPNAVNLDASRLIYEGPVVTGGGHSDIFKDDVVYLIWSASRLEAKP
ncbi:MAG: hypothetical protein IH944_02700 [Armatimonadetes bacterium]|nr:hypothetical protein [Armatimonadota bacterium]